MGKGQFRAFGLTLRRASFIAGDSESGVRPQALMIIDG
jgi:hypothetical protein